MPRLAVPARFHQHFELERYVASGQCGAVYQARYKDGSRVALKVFDKEHDKTVFGYFTNEQLLLRLVKEHRQHPHIAEYMESNLVRPPYFVATRFVEGARELHSLLGRPLAPGFVARVVKQTASALDYLHTGHPEYSPIIHRDVKPSNLLIDAACNVVLIDLSIARHPGYAIDDEPGLGTIPYMAPEQYLGGEEPATDQFALALVAFQMLTGKALLPNNVKKAQRKLEALRANQHAQVHALLGSLTNTAKVMQTALAFEPSRRFPSCAAFAHELQRALEADKQSLAETMPPAPPRSRTYLGYSVMGAVGVSAAAVLVVTLLGTPVPNAGEAAPTTLPRVVLASVAAPSESQQPLFQPEELGGRVQPVPTTVLVDAPASMPTPSSAPIASRKLSTVAAQTQPAVTIKARSAEPLRATPSTDALILLRIPPGAQAIRTGREKPQRLFTWYEVTYGGRTGWCRSSYCQPLGGGR